MTPVLERRAARGRVIEARRGGGGGQLAGQLGGGPEVVGEPEQEVAGHVERPGGGGDLVERRRRRAGAGQAAAAPGAEASRRPAAEAVTSGKDGSAGMNERDESGAEKRAPVRVATREQFDEAVEELFRTGQPIEAPSLEDLAAWDVDLEDEAGGIEVA